MDQARVDALFPSAQQPDQGQPSESTAAEKLFPSMTESKPEEGFDITRAKASRALGGQVAQDDPRIDDVLREQGKLPEKPQALPEPPKPAEPAGDYEFQFPENHVADPRLLSDFQATAKELNLPQDQAQRLLDLHNASQDRMYDAFSHAVTKQHETRMTEWEAETTKTVPAPDIEAAQRFVASDIVPNEVREMLEKTGLGSYPPVVKLFANLAKSSR